VAARADLPSCGVTARATARYFPEVLLLSPIYRLEGMTLYD